MEVLQNLFDNSSFPMWSAFLLGLMTAISPCPLATNITAIGFIGKNIENRNKVFINGLIYTLGRAISYTALGIIIYFGASQFDISTIFQGWGEKILGPVLVIIGLFMLGVIKIPGNTLSNFINKIGQKQGNGIWGSLFLGILFALAFCPYSGILYFGMLMPLTLNSANGLFLPVVFAIATGLPVIIFAWLIAYMLNGVGNVYNKIKIFESWFRRVVAVLFMGVGVYYIYIFYL